MNNKRCDGPLNRTAEAHSTHAVPIETNALLAAAAPRALLERMWCLPGSKLPAGALGWVTLHETDAPPEEDAPTSLLSPDEHKNLAAHEVAIGTTDFICRWVSYGEERTDAPAVFHHMAALVLVATAINRNCWLDLQQKTVYPSIFAGIGALGGPASENGRLRHRDGGPTGAPAAGAC